MKMAPESQLPAEMKDQPARVKEAYRFAIANPDLLKQIPCFCGCVAEQHKSNYNCYVAKDGGPGSVLDFDNHAMGCGICVDITQDVMTMQQEGKSVDEMREVINQRYGTFGPSTDDAGKYRAPANSCRSPTATQTMSKLPNTLMRRGNGPLATLKDRRGADRSVGAGRIDCAAAQRGRAAAERSIVLDARMFAFKPGRLRVNQGDRVTITLRPRMSCMASYMDGYGVDIQAEPGKPATAHLHRRPLGQVPLPLLGELRRHAPLHDRRAGRRPQHPLLARRRSAADRGRGIGSDALRKP